MPFFWQAGGEIVDADNNFTLDSEACVEALTYYDSFFENGLAQPSVSDVPVEAQFADGTVGAFISGPWMIGLVTDAGADPETWTVAHQPTNVTGTSFVGGGNLAVFEQADNKDGRLGVRRVRVPARGAGAVVRDGKRPAGRAGRGTIRHSPTTNCSRCSVNSSRTAKSPPRSRRGRRSPRRSTAKSSR